MVGVFETVVFPGWILAAGLALSALVGLKWHQQRSFSETGFSKTADPEANRRMAKSMAAVDARFVRLGFVVAAFGLVDLAVWAFIHHPLVAGASSIALAGLAIVGLGIGRR